MKIVLVILDGWGHSDNNSEYNAIDKNECKIMRRLSRHYKSYLINASGIHVGLPEGSMGNSEVGHLTIGSGRVIKQSLCMINDAISDGTYEEKLLPVINCGVETLHLIGLVSDGGVHSHINHLIASVKILHDRFTTINIHCISDGRDTAPDVLSKYLQEIQELCSTYKNVTISSVGGRYYAMDRDNNYDRINNYFDCVTNGGPSTNDINKYISMQYSKGNYDETIEPVMLSSYRCIKKSDAIFFFNFRADRMRHISSKFVSENYTVYTMTNYGENTNTVCLFETQNMNNTLAEVLSSNNISQKHIAETEKYAHVTYFFNGNRETPFELQENIIVDSIKTKTYAECPEMSSVEVTNEILKAMKFNTGFVVANYAAADMVGHTGNFEATKRAVAIIDEEIGRVHDECIANGYVLLVTADHGNAEVMYDDLQKKIDKRHTNSQVPLIVSKQKSKCSADWGYEKSAHGLQDIAPTILALFGITRPDEMTGNSIL